MSLLDLEDEFCTLSISQWIRQESDIKDFMEYLENNIFAIMPGREREVLLSMCHMNMY